MVSETDILRRARQGEEEAFRMLVEQHGRTVYKLAYRLTGNAHDAEDAVQETFLRLFQRIGSFQERSRFDTWLYRVAANAAMDVVRRRQRHRTRQAPLENAAGDPLPLSADEPDAERLARSAQVGSQVEAAMGCLTSGERAAFTLRHLQGMSIRDIGEALGLGPNAVKNAIFRAVRKMRRELAPVASESS